MQDLKPIDSNLFFSRNDPADPRLGEKVVCQAPISGVTILGYPDDEGIQINGGRKGAADGPTEIRRWLYKMTPNASRSLKSFADLGDLHPTLPLKDRHEAVRNLVGQQLKKNLQVLSLGGGNDYAYADGAAFLDAFERQKPLIINVDAHLDVRDLSKGISSGTPFYRLLEMTKFDFVELAVQSSCNAKGHADYVKAKGGRILSVEDQMLSGKTWLQFAQEHLRDWLTPKRPTFLAIDIDAFAWPFAQGSSASWPMGLTPQDFYPLFHSFLKDLDVRVLGVYEVSPALDQGAGTAKLAAQLAHVFLHEL